MLNLLERIPYNCLKGTLWKEPSTNLLLSTLMLQYFFSSWLLHAEFLKNGKGANVIIMGGMTQHWHKCRTSKATMVKSGIPPPTSLCHYQATAIRVAHYAQQTFISAPNDAGLNFQK